MKEMSGTKLSVPITSSHQKNDKEYSSMHRVDPMTEEKSDRGRDRRQDNKKCVCKKRGEKEEEEKERK